MSSELSNCQNLEEAGWWHFFLLDSFFFLGGEYQTYVCSGYLLVPKMCVCVFCVLQILDK